MKCGNPRELLFQLLWNKMWNLYTDHSDNTRFLDAVNNCFRNKRLRNPQNGKQLLIQSWPVHQLVYYISAMYLNYISIRFSTSTDSQSQKINYCRAKFQRQEPHKSRKKINEPKRGTLKNCMFSGDRETISRHHVSLRANASHLSKKKKKSIEEAWN